MITSDHTSYKGFWVRGAAAVCDVLLVSITIIFLEATYGAIAYDLSTKISLESLIFNKILLIAYFALLESSRFQATLGKYLFGLAVCNSGGGRISLLQAFGRNILKILPIFWLLYAGRFAIQSLVIMNTLTIIALLLTAGLLFVFFSKKKQALHDEICGTYVVAATADEFTRKVFRRTLVTVVVINAFYLSVLFPALLL